MPRSLHRAVPSIHRRGDSHGAPWHALVVTRDVSGSVGGGDQQPQAESDGQAVAPVERSLRMPRNGADEDPGKIATVRCDIGR